MNSACLKTLWPYLLIVMLVGAIQATMALLEITPVLNGRLADTDSYMWLLRAENLVNGQGWFSHAVPRMNAPFGDVLNWSRPTDLVILFCALPFRLFMDWRTAIFWGGSVMAPLAQLGLGFALAWAFAPFVPKLARPLLMLFVLVQPALIAYSLAGRPDHHGLLLITQTVYLGLLTRAILNGFGLRAGFMAGLAIAIGLWVTVEAQFLLMLMIGLFGLLWLWRGGQRRLDFLVGHGLGLFAGIIAALLVERGLTWSGDPALDKISLVHLLLAAGNLIIWLPLRERAGAGAINRLVSMTATGVMALGAVALIHWPALKGPAAQIDPRVMKEFFLNINEMKPLWPDDAESFTTAIVMLGCAFWGLAVWLFAYRRAMQTAWLPFALSAAVMTGAALVHARFAMFATPLCAGLLVAAMEKMLAPGDGAQKAGPRRVALRTLLLLMPFLLIFASAALVPETKEQEAKAKACDLGPLTTVLADPHGLGQTPAIIMAPLNHGPELLYFTPHAAVSGPYHRNRDGILDTIDFFRAKDDEVAHAILKKRGIGYVLFCEKDFEGPKVNPAQLGVRLLKGETPRWLQSLMALKDSHFRIFKVI